MSLVTVSLLSLSPAGLLGLELPGGGWSSDVLDADSPCSSEAPKCWAGKVVQGLPGATSYLAHDVGSMASLRLVPRLGGGILTVALVHWCENRRARAPSPEQVPPCGGHLADGSFHG
jgi:hypothetical protein